MNAMKVRWKGETEFLMLTHDKVYTVLGMEKGWYRLVDDSGEDYLYPPEMCLSNENVSKRAPKK